MPQTFVSSEVETSPLSAVKKAAWRPLLTTEQKNRCFAGFRENKEQNKQIINLANASIKDIILFTKAEILLKNRKHHSNNTYMECNNALFLKVVSGHLSEVKLNNYNNHKDE